MADPPLDPDTGDDAGSVGPDRGSTTGMPRWVKAFLVVALAVILLLVILLLTGGGHGPGRHMGGGDDAAPSTGQHDAGGVGEPADAAQAARTVEVTTLDTMTFEPSTVSVSAGETVTFVVANAGQVVHEFTLGNAAMQQEHAEAMDHMPAGMAHDTANSVTLQAGETKRLTWRFRDGATLEYACHQPDYYQAGMRGQITIT